MLIITYLLQILVWIFSSCNWRSVKMTFPEMREDEQLVRLASEFRSDWWVNREIRVVIYRGPCSLSLFLPLVVSPVALSTVKTDSEAVGLWRRWNYIREECAAVSPYLLGFNFEIKTFLVVEFFGLDPLILAPEDSSTLLGGCPRDQTLLFFDLPNLNPPFISELNVTLVTALRIIFCARLPFPEFSCAGLLQLCTFAAVLLRWKRNRKNAYAHKLPFTAVRGLKNAMCTWTKAAPVQLPSLGDPQIIPDFHNNHNLHRWLAPGWPNMCNSRQSRGSHQGYCIYHDGRNERGSVCCSRFYFPSSEEIPKSVLNARSHKWQTVGLGRNNLNNFMVIFMYLLRN